MRTRTGTKTARQVYEQAEVFIRELLLRDASNSDALIALIFLLVITGQHEKAQAEFERFEHANVLEILNRNLLNHSVREKPNVILFKGS